MTPLREMIAIKSREYCDDIQRATGDVCLSPELLGEIITAIAREAAEQGARHALISVGWNVSLIEQAVAAVLGDEP